MIWRTLPALLSTFLVTRWAMAERPNDRPPSGPSAFALRTGHDAAVPAGQRVSFKRHACEARELVGADSPVRQDPGEHPLTPAVRWAKETLPAIERMNDYSATLIIRERVGGKLGKRQAYAVKIRHRPFSVYTCGLAPAAIKGEEAIYVEGQNDGKLWAHCAGIGALMPTLSLDPKGSIAMRDLHYPITEIGILNMVRRMIAEAEEDRHRGDCEVHYFTGGRINGRACSWCQVVHPVRRDYFKFNVARIFVDDQLRIPVRYEAYGWPKQPGGQPELLEEYSYVDLKLDNGFTAEDFSIDNPAYHFHKTLDDLVMKRLEHTDATPR